MQRDFWESCAAAEKTVFVVDEVVMVVPRRKLEEDDVDFGKAVVTWSDDEVFSSGLVLREGTSGTRKLCSMFLTPLKTGCSGGILAISDSVVDDDMVCGGLTGEFFVTSV